MNPGEQGDLFDPSTVAWITSRRSLPLLSSAIFDAAEVVIDLETTGLNEHATGTDPDWPVPARVSLASLTLPTAAEPDNPRPPTFVLPLSHPDSPMCAHWRQTLREVAEVIRRWGGPMSNQNLKFDLKWIEATTGVDLSHLFAWDTQIGAHLLDETTSTSLKDRVPAVFGVERWDDFDLSTPGASERVPLFDLGLYAARDTYWTWRWAVLQRTLMGTGREGEGQDDPETPDEVEDRRLGSLAVWCAMPTSANLTSIEQRGMRLDVDWVRGELASLSASMERDFKSLTSRYDVPEHSDHEGIDPCAACRLEQEPSLAPTSLWFREWTRLAVRARDLEVTAMTPNGAPQWSKEVLNRQARQGSEVAQTLLDYRRAVKRAEYLRSWLSEVTPKRTVHTTYHAGRVVTGRLSSSGPNMQQVTGSLKPAFVPREGNFVAEMDYSQIELRIVAYMSRCEPMLEAFRRGDDLHRLLAARITGKPPAGVTADDRQYGKAGNFGLIYGMSPGGFRDYADAVYGVSFTPEEAVRVHEAFFNMWPGLAAWHEQQQRRARQTGQVVSPIGRVRRLPDIWDGNDSVASHAERQAVNAPVQGFASDVMQVAAASIAGHLPGYDPLPEVWLTGTVHDSIVAEVPVVDWKRSVGRAMRRMMNLNPVLSKMGCTLDVPLTVEAKVGTRWGLADVGIIK